MSLEGSRAPKRLLIRRNDGESVAYDRTAHHWKIPSQDGSPPDVCVRYEHEASWIRDAGHESDKGYDNAPFHDGCMDRGICPVTPLRETPAVVRGDHRPPSCEHGEWTFAGADYKRRATKWRCPTGECKPASRWIKADRLDPLIPRDSERSRVPLTRRRRARVRTPKARVGRYSRPASVVSIGSGSMPT